MLLRVALRYLLIRGISGKAPPPGVMAAMELNRDELKKRVAYFAVDRHVQDGTTVGVGTGTTAQHVVFRLGEKFRSGELRNIVCVPSSFHSRFLIIENGLQLSDLERTTDLDVYIDGADEVDSNLNCIKGGGGCLTQEKLVQAASRKFVVIADHLKRSERLGRVAPRIPIEVVPVAHLFVKRRILAQEGGECTLRMAAMKAGPVITDNGNYILDWKFPAPDNPTSEHWRHLHQRLKQQSGIVETGLFIGVANSACFAFADGSVQEFYPPDPS